MRFAAAAAIVVTMLLTGPAVAAGPALSKAEVGAKLEQAMGLIETDPAKARQLVEQAAIGGDPEALNHLAMFVMRGIGGPADEARAIAMYEQAAEKGSTGARLSLGHMLIHQETEAERRRGVAYLEQAYADPKAAGFAASGLGLAYAFGWGVERDTDKAVELLEQASKSDGDNDEVEALLGRAYHAGYGKLDPDPKRAYPHFRKAAEMGNPRAAWTVGMALINGDGVGKDEAEAYKWVRRSAEAGDFQGQISTAVMLATGQGVKEDDAEARVWYRKAAEQNSAHALRGLGMMMIVGEGGPVDQARGLAYVELADEGGDEQAPAILKSLKTDITPEFRAEVDRFKSEWIAKHGKPRPDS